MISRGITIRWFQCHLQLHNTNNAGIIESDRSTEDLMSFIFNIHLLQPMMQSDSFIFLQAVESMRMRMNELHCWRTPSEGGEAEADEERTGTEVEIKEEAGRAPGPYWARIYAGLDGAIVTA